MSIDFHTALLREKFVLNDVENPSTPPVVALSNRISLMLTSPGGKESETFVIRAHNMHTCIRMAAATAKEFEERGAIMARMTEFKWDYLWKDVTKGYERDWNPDIWGAVYFKGKKLFESGQHHAFLDIIEQCDAHNKGGEYEESLAVAENAFQKAGKTVKIDHDANIALVVKIKDDGDEEREARCGVILRSMGKTTTFNYTVTPKKTGGEMVAIPTLLTVSAAFLEGVQLAFTVGMLNKKRDLGLIVKYSDEDRKAEKSTSRLINLNTAISRFEQKFTVIYRPERPHFAEMANEAESKAMKILQPLIDEKIAAGEMQQEKFIE